ncbi:DUF5983 family protein [Citrobacter braakii]|uniref:DUF5983 family protein n=1 Tax=Citrobacter braakii TaxID=57706 RepID=UPI0040398523
MKKFTHNAPYGVTVIQLENGDEALYLHGECLACADFAEKDDPVCGIGERLAETLGVPFRLLELPVPDDEEWAWNDVVEGLGWGRGEVLDRMVVRPVLECCINHITEEDNLLLADLGQAKFEGAWILDTDVGYLIRLDAKVHPLLHLKRLGLSKAMRKVIAGCIKQADISMIHFSQVGEELPGADTFNW